MHYAGVLQMFHTIWSLRNIRRVNRISSGISLLEREGALSWYTCMSNVMKNVDGFGW